MTFGCGVCFPPSADAAWTARQGLAQVARLVEEPHVSVWIGACGTCRQRYLSVFTERIDWVNGEDPQDWALMPVTEEEAAALVGGVSAGEIGVGRRCLRAYHPSDEGMRVFWSVGPAVIGPHD